MARRAVGTIFVDLDLNAEEYTKKQKQIITESKSTALSVEKNWRIIGSQSDAMYDAMRQRINNAYNAIKNKATTTANEIARAEKSAKAELRKIDEQQYGKQISMIDKLKANWIAYAAAITAAFYAVRKGISVVDDAIKYADSIAKTADKIGLTTSELQEYRYAADIAGVSTAQLDMGMQRFSRRIAEVASGTGELKAIVQQYGVQIRNNDGTMRKNSEILSDFSNVIRNASSEQEKLRIAFKLFDSEGAALVNMLKNGDAALNKMRQDARDLGIVIDEKLIRNAEVVNDRFTTLTYILKSQMTSAILDLAPLIIGLTDNLIKLTGTVSNAVEGFDMFFGISKKGELYKELNMVNEELERQEKILAGKATIWDRLQAKGSAENAAQNIIKLKGYLKDITDQIANLNSKPNIPIGIGGDTTLSDQKVLDDLLKQQRDYNFKTRQLDRNTYEQKRQEVLRWASDYTTSLYELGKLDDTVRSQIANTTAAKLKFIDAEYRKDFLDKYAELGKTKFDIERMNLEKELEIFRSVERDKTKVAEYETKVRSNILRREHEDRLSLYQNILGSVSNTFLQIAQMGGKYSKDAFAVYQATAIAEATIAMALGISKAIGEYPPPWSFIAAAAQGAAAAVQIAAITNAKPPSYDSGGISNAKGIYQTGDIMEAHVPIPSGKIPVEINGSGAPRVEVHNHIEGNTFYDKDKQQQVFIQLAKAVAEQVAPSAIAKDWHDGGVTYETFRGK